ncbi:tetratricopeptide repeat protein [Amphibacillus jilinensis]|uniref:tetratricopeptide repeat protein n=1 Tax=Amphibacillus jilinensis TaxID=1216008 RepID=UPI000307BD33|nr:hypothetical protein [Amphibacillus jilinensis]
MPRMHNYEENQLNKNVIPFIPEGEFYFAKGVDAFYKRKFDIALKWLKKAAETDPKEALYQAQMSIIYTEIGAYHAANQVLTTIIKEHGESYYDCYYLIANNYAHLGLLRDAQKYASLYLEKDPDGEFHDETEQLLTLLELSLEDEETDESFAEEDEWLIYQETAFYHIQRHEWVSALPILQEMMTRFPSYAMAKHQYHYALFFSGKRDEAIGLAETFYKNEPTSILSKTNLLIFHAEQGHINITEAFIEALINVYPIQVEQSLRIAIALSYTTYLTQAYQRFKLLTKSKLSNHLDYFRAFAKVAYLNDNKDHANQIWMEGCHLHPELAKENAPWSRI